MNHRRAVPPWLPPTVAYRPEYTSSDLRRALLIDIFSAAWRELATGLSEEFFLMTHQINITTATSGNPVLRKPVCTNSSLTVEIRVEQIAMTVGRATTGWAGSLCCGITYSGFKHRFTSGRSNTSIRRTSFSGCPVRIGTAACCLADCICSIAVSRGVFQTRFTSRV